MAAGTQGDGSRNRPCKKQRLGWQRLWEQRPREHSVVADVAAREEALRQLARSFADIAGAAASRCIPIFSVLMAAPHPMQPRSGWRARRTCLPCTW